MTNAIQPIMYKGRCGSLRFIRCVVQHLSITAIILLVTTLQTATAQTSKIDSLKKILYTGVDQRVMLNTVLELCEENESLNVDTLKHYATIASSLAEKLQLAEKAQRAECYQILYLYKKNELDTALGLLDNLIKKYTASNAYNEMYVSMYTLKFNVYWRKNSFNDAIAAAQELIRMSELNKDVVGMIKGYVCRGAAKHLGSNDAPGGLKWYMQAFALMDSEERKIKFNMVYSNIAIAYEDLEKMDSVRKYLTAGLDYARKGSNLASLARALRLYGSFMADNGKLDEAAAAIREATEVQKKIGDVFGTVRALRGEADFYMGAHQYSRAISILFEATSLAEKNGIEQMMVYDLYNAISLAYDSAGDYGKSAAILRKMLQIKDSNYKANTATEMAALQTKFDLQKKETQIVNQRLELLRKNVLLTSFAVLCIAIAIASIILFRRYREKQKLKLSVALEKEKTIRAHVVKDAENKERKRIAADLHDNLGVQANAILHNATMLQQEHSDKNKVSENLQQMAKEMLLNLRETLWAMKSDSITAGEVWIRLINFSQMMMRQYKLIQINTTGEAPEFTLPSPQALNIVMMVQEAVSNSIQHAQASQIHTSSFAYGNNWHITVTDNGTGFDFEQAKLKSGHYGLTHLEERAAAASISLQVNSAPGNGTVVTIVVPLK